MFFSDRQTEVVKWVHGYVDCERRGLISAGFGENRAARAASPTTALLDTVDRSRMLPLERGVPVIPDRVVQPTVEEPGDGGPLVVESGVG
ncbi:hypothetical protein RHMOL_Rhmol07G0159500 [Rhododendron molle]|uniref:Uncharacterized protein n=1 Tax=Rhododendron molle TaxID=49168 RepID=A0ACC0N350_RHOML|nr:hypothetical protein RHMOL_Rhmol07G0159500 [Rhododendron molle]